MSFLVEVTHPTCASDQHDRRIPCGSLVDLAAELDEATGCGVWAALELAAEIVHGDCHYMEFEDEETGRLVSAQRATAGLVV